MMRSYSMTVRLQAAEPTSERVEDQQEEEGLQRLQAMRDRKHDRGSELLADDLLHHDVQVMVKRCGRFIENDHACVAEQAARDRIQKG